MDEIADWLRSLGLEQYAAAFADNFIDASLVGDLTDHLLKEIGITAVGHRMKILRAAATFGAVAPAAAAAEREVAPKAQASVIRPKAPRPLTRNDTN